MAASSLAPITIVIQATVAATVLDFATGALRARVAGVAHIGEGTAEALAAKDRGDAWGVASGVLTEVANVLGLRALRGLYRGKVTRSLPSSIKPGVAEQEVAKLVDDLRNKVPEVVKEVESKGYATGRFNTERNAKQFLDIMIAKISKQIRDGNLVVGKDASPGYREQVAKLFQREAEQMVEKELPNAVKSLPLVVKVSKPEGRAGNKDDPTLRGPSRN
jgi:hypothetical protein